MRKIITKRVIERQYQSEPSFSDFLPWVEWSDEHNIMLLEDGRSVGAVLEIRDIATEGKPECFSKALHEKITKAFSSIIPLKDENPWVLQFFVQDDLTLDALYRRLEDYIRENNTLDDPLAKKYLSVMKDHFKIMTRDEGVFIDPMSELPFRGKSRRIRLVIYRRYTQVKKGFDVDVIEELELTVKKLKSQLKQIGVKNRRVKGAALYQWLVRWFNPKPNKTGGDIDKLLSLFPYPKEKPFGWSFSQNIFFKKVHSYELGKEKGWVFDDLKHKLLMFTDLQNQIDIGVISRERDFGENNKYALLDKFPPGTIYTIQIVFESKRNIKRHLQALEKAAVGKGLLIEEKLKNIQAAHHQIEQNNMLFRCVEGIYFRGESDVVLKDIETELISLLNNSNLDVIETQDELFPIDNYLRLLPFNFNPDFDAKETHRSTYKYASDIVKLLPIYGRSKGDSLHPLFVFFNRGGEPFIFDHLNKHFKMTNSHMMIAGTTGAGKSVTLNNLCMALSAVHNPRIVVMEVGGSFDLTAQFLDAHGRKVRCVKFDKEKPVATNPYVEWKKALRSIYAEEKVIREQTGSQSDEQGIVLDEILVNHADILLKEAEGQQDKANSVELALDQNRDILNEMTLATRTMITGGLEREEVQISRVDIILIQRGIIFTMKTCHQNGSDDMLVQDVIQGFNTLSKNDPNPELQTQLKKFALSMEIYQSGLRSQFVNRPSKPLEDADFLHVDFGFLQEESYKDLMNIACITLLSRILALAETMKTSGRPTILILDEAHVLFKSPTIALFVTLMAKVARKIGLWIIVCSQNMGDFKGVESKKVLSMMETWLCLSLDAAEVKLVEQFKPLTDEMRNLIYDIRKYPGKYTEGVLLGKRYSGIFRNVPPRLALSLAMTEQSERSARARIQKEHHLSELQAVEFMAKALETPEVFASEDEGFDD